MTVMTTTRIMVNRLPIAAWHAVWLIIHLIAVIAVTKMNASPLETLLTSMNAPVAFSVFIGSVDSFAGRFGGVKSGIKQRGPARDESVLWFVLATISLTCLSSR